MLAQSSLESDCFCRGFKNKIFVIISLYSAYILWRKSNCTSAKGHTGLKEGASAECCSSCSIPASPSLKHGRMLKSICVSWSSTGMQQPRCNPTHFPVWVLGALHGSGSSLSCCLQQAEWHKDKLSPPSSCDRLQRFSILPGQESERQLHFFFHSEPDSPTLQFNGIMEYFMVSCL